MNGHHKLANGVVIPDIGFGTWQIPDGEPTRNAVLAALDAGFRLIDTAAIYGNESGVGDALRATRIPRSEIFLTTKVWNGDQGYESTLKAFSTSLAKLGTDYVDLYLIHWPAVNLYPDYKQTNKETWRAMEKIYAEGKARAIGVCNFFPQHFDGFYEAAVVKPMVDQIELHPGNPAADVVAYCHAHNILVEAFSPMMKGKIFDLPILAEIAARHGRTVPQIVLRWILDQGIVPLSKSVTPARIQSNFDVFGFHLDCEDNQKIATLAAIGRVGSHPDKARF